MRIPKITLRTLVALTIITGASLLSTPLVVQALDNEFPDWADTSGAAVVYNVIGQTQYVRQQDANLRIWSKSNSISISIVNAHYCADNSYDYAQSGDPIDSFGDISGGTAVTNYTAGGTTKYGYKYNVGDNTCDDTVDFSFTGVTQNENGYYYVDIDVKHIDQVSGDHDGIMNYYRIIASNASDIIGVRAGSSGYDVVQEQTDTAPANTNYYGRFGTDCSITTNQTAKINFYDLDNAGGAGAQKNGDVTVQLYDVTAGSNVNFSAYGTYNSSGAEVYGGDPGTTWTPPSIDNDRQWVKFTAVPNHKYRLDINNVYYNNTIQYSLPYSQINYLACPSSATLSAKSGAALNRNVGTVVPFNLSIGATDVDGVQGDVSWKVQRSDDGGATAYDVAGAGMSGTTTITSGDFVTAAPSFTPDTRGTYCYRITMTSKPDYATYNPQTSPWQCVTVAGWDINASSTVDGVTKKIIFKGQKATFRHHLWSTGAPLHKNVNGDILVTQVAANFNSTDCVALPAAPSTCWNYRYTSTDLTPGSSDRTGSWEYTFSQTGTYCERLSYNPSRDNAGAATGNEACVYVIDPVPGISSNINYEKNEAGLLPITFSMSHGYCPPPGSGTIDVRLTYTIDFTPTPRTDTITVPWGESSCGDGSRTITNLEAHEKDQLNNTYPGGQVKFTAAIVETGVTSAPGYITVLEVPYVRFYGNDVVARNGFALFNASPAAEDKGSATQFGAFATASIGLNTATFRYGYANGSVPKDGLKSNVTARAPKSASDVIMDLALPDDCVTTNTWGDPTGADGVACINYNGTINLGTTGPDVTVVPSGHIEALTTIPYTGKGTVKTTGNMYITKNLINSTPLADYSDPKKTAVLLLISDGDIYIDKNVSQVDAILMAKGTIYTCTNSTSLISQAQLDEQCRAKNLTINGSVIAGKIKFERSVGTRLFNNEGNNSSQAGASNIASRDFTNHTTVAGGALQKASEVVNFPAYLYFAKPYLQDTSGTRYSQMYTAPSRL